MTNWPADKVERRPIDQLIPYARNARTHSDEQLHERRLTFPEGREQLLSLLMPEIVENVDEKTTLAPEPEKATV